jgi:hypothetical protein
MSQLAGRAMVVPDDPLIALDIAKRVPEGGLARACMTSVQSEPSVF